MIRTMLPALSLLAAVGLPGALAATCYGHTDCRACKNCRYCKHCAKRGGTCGVCKRLHNGRASTPPPKEQRPLRTTGRGSAENSGHMSRAQRKPRLPVELSGVFALRAATR